MSRRPALTMSLLLAVTAVVAACADEAGPSGSGSAGGGAGTTSRGGQGGVASQVSPRGGGQGGTTAGAAGAVTPPPTCAERLANAKPGYQIDDRLPDFEILAADGSTRRLRDATTSCDAAPSLLVLRVEASFCGPCAEDANGAASALAPVAGVPGAEPLTLLYADVDAAPATPRDAILWRAAHPTLPGEIAAAPDEAFVDVVRARKFLPVWLVLDARTQVLLDVLDSPAPDRIAPSIAEAWTAISGAVVTVPDPSITRIDGRFRPDEWALLQQMTPVPDPPPSPSNAFADRVDAAALGQTLFADGELAGPGGVSCATCHVAEKGLADGLPVAVGKGVGKLHTPAITLAAHQRWSFWDGRADTLWSQALGPMEDPHEMAGSRLGVVARVASTHRAAYEGVFGALPSSSTSFPTAGKPGDPSWDELSEADRADANRVFVNVGKALEAFERTFRSPPTRFDAYLAGDTEALDEVERDGLALFLAAGCATCHYGPRLTDDAFHDLLVPSHELPADRGRIDGVTKLLASPFRADGVFSDDASAGARLPFLTSSPALLGQVKTPTLRNVKNTGPWGHSGRFETLAEVINHYGKERPKAVEGGPTIGVEDPTLGKFSTPHGHAIEAFLGTL